MYFALQKVFQLMYFNHIRLLHKSIKLYLKWPLSRLLDLLFIIVSQLCGTLPQPKRIFSTIRIDKLNS